VSVRVLPALVVLLALVGACSGGGNRPAKPGGGPLRMTSDAGGLTSDAAAIKLLTGPERMLENRYYVREGAPEPLACVNDRDCIGDTVTDETGCCVRTPDSYPQTWTWHAWLTQRRLSEDCDTVKCPPLPSGGMPAMCRLDVHCVNSRCADSCASENPDDQQDGGQKQAPQKK
jgi:hypothetical protein